MMTEALFDPESLGTMPRAASKFFEAIFGEFSDPRSLRILVLMTDE
jgi:hypothetical protein